MTLEAFCMNNNTDLPTVRRLAKEVVDEWELIGGKVHTDEADANKHLINQIRFKLYAERRDTFSVASKQSTGPRCTPYTRPKAPRNVNNEWEGLDIPIE